MGSSTPPFPKECASVKLETTKIFPRRLPFIFHPWRTMQSGVFPALGRSEHNQSFFSDACPLPPYKIFISLNLNDGAAKTLSLRKPLSGSDLRLFLTRLTLAGKPMAKKEGAEPPRPRCCMVEFALEADGKRAADGARCAHLQGVVVDGLRIGAAETVGAD